MHIKNKRGQSTVEYILLVTAVIAVMIVFATNQNGALPTQLNTALNQAVADIGDKIGTLSNSHFQCATGTPGTIENVYMFNVTP